MPNTIQKGSEKTKDRTLKKKEIVELTARLLGLFRHLLSDYLIEIKYNTPSLKVGDWAFERSYLGQFPIEAILKITSIDKDGSFIGVDLLGEKRTWGNADFVPLPKHCQDYLNGKYRF